MNVVKQLWADQEKSIMNLDSRLIEKFQSSKNDWWEKDFPKGQEFWKYVRFSELSKINWQLPADCTDSNTINFSKEGHTVIEINNFSLSAKFERLGSVPQGLEIHSIQEVLADPKLAEKFSERLFAQSKGNFFENINASFFSNGLVINIAKNTEVGSIQISMKSQKDCEFINPRILVVAGAGSHGQITFDTSMQGSQFLNYSRDIYLDENAHLKVFSKEKGSSSSYILDSINLFMKRSSQCEYFDMTLPSKWTRHNIVSHLQGEGAEVRLVGSYLNEKDYFCDHHTIINHACPSTFSYQNYKGILTDTSRAVFNGRVHIAPGASKSNSEQLNKNLLLSEKAEINTKPELQIYNDDVKAAHGATVGQLDKEQLFYLQTRGIRKEAAWQLLSEAFVYDLFEGLPEENRNFFTESLEKTLTDFQGGH